MADYIFKLPDIGEGIADAGEHPLPVRLALDRAGRYPVVVAVGHPVEPVDELVDHVGERLDEGDAGVADVVVSPFRAVLRNAPLGLVNQILKMARIEICKW